MVSPRFALTYKVNNIMNVYGGVSIGKRSGYPQINITNPTVDTYEFTTNNIGNETLISYEIGAKGQTKNSYFDAALYTYDYKDFQTISLDVSEGTANAGKATAWGFEGVVSTTLTSWLDGYANYAYIDTEYENFFDTLNGERVDLSGNEFRLAPKHTFSIGLDTIINISGDWDFFANTRYSYRSKYFFNNDNLETERQEGFGLLDFNIGIENFSKGYKIELYAENATDKEWNRDVGNAGKLFGTTTAIRANPRFYGVRLRAAF
ncbi:TonB-dependent receptor [Paraglaciecola aquimarina]|uniref:TonB-dependent receptor n=1 Tax=Paraglaciecola aquimarina TaxID=1235557 RepID=A0ABU3T0S5_9ALTE|nr:TonB-dependent receptor [Paraglaciecola aquimarina]MDU0355856.1 TonB-dependent receptor [Paraglaciecola aquimarina]